MLLHFLAKLARPPPPCCKGGGRTVPLPPFIRGLNKDKFYNKMKLINATERQKDRVVHRRTKIKRISTTNENVFRANCLNVFRFLLLNSSFSHPLPCQTWYALKLYLKLNLSACRSMLSLLLRCTVY